MLAPVPTAKLATRMPTLIARSHPTVLKVELVVLLHQIALLTQHQDEVHAWRRSNCRWVVHRCELPTDGAYHVILPPVSHAQGSHAGASANFDNHGCAADVCAFVRVSVRKILIVFD
jgi:hypothetical protein